MTLGARALGHVAQAPVTAQVSGAILGEQDLWDAFGGMNDSDEKFEKLRNPLLKGNVSNSGKNEGRAPWLWGSILAVSQTGSLPDFYFWCLVVK